MASPSDAVDFSADGIRDFIRDKGGKVSNSQLAKHYRLHLLDPRNHELNKALFKQFISAVGSIRREGNEKYVILKKSDELQTNSFERLDDSLKQLKINGEFDSMSKNHDWNTVGIPVAPPRRKHDENRQSMSREPSEDNIESQSLSSNDEIISSASKVSVKERAKKLNKMVSETELVLRPKNNTNRKHKHDKFDDDDVDSATVALDAHTKEWIVKAASADYDSLARLLKEDTRLARYKTALHWAAKHGKLEVVRLIAAAPGSNVNIRSGFTPLHIAAQFKRHDAYELLKSTYNANTRIRDNSGHTADEYLKTPAHRREQELARQPVTRKESKRDVENSKDLGFLRLGSFNVKVRRTTDATVNKSSKMTKLHKSWGSADSLPEKTDKVLMPPPKIVLSHKSHKHRKASVSSGHRSTYC